MCDVFCSDLIYLLLLVHVRLDLVGDSYTFGRGETCDYQFSTNSAITNPCYQAYSKVHFKVTKVICSIPSCFFSSYRGE